MAFTLTRFEVAGLDEHNDWDNPVAVRCTLCGRWSDLRLHHDDATLLSDLVAWATRHQCAPLRVS